MSVVRAVDLFAGAGGLSTGLVQACLAGGVKLELAAVNHWETAVQTHAANHPWARHVCHDLDDVNPRSIAKPDELEILIAAPECTYHSRARGGGECDEQSRSTAWHVLRWADALRPRAILVENVKEFTEWGPLGKDKRPIKSQKGRIFRDWLRTLRGLGYTCRWQVLCCANHGDATTRERFFLLAVRGRGELFHPAPTHGRDPGLWALEPWKPAREVIDWNIRSTPLHERKRPLKPKTMARIEAGIRKFWGEWAEPFLLVLRNHADGQSLDRPTPTLTASGEHLGLIEPLVMGQHGGAAARPASEPIPTVATKGAISLVEPFVASWDHQGPGGIWPGSAPLSTVTTKARHGVVQPLLVPYYGAFNALTVGQPVPTVTCKDRFGLVEPAGLAIGFRMLQPKELAAAHSFPPDYVFKGRRKDVVKQIGNSVPVKTGEALCRQILEVVR